MPLSLSLSLSFFFGHIIKTLTCFCSFSFIQRMSERQHLRIYREIHRASGKGGVYYSQLVYLAERRKPRRDVASLSRSLSPVCYRKCVKRRFC